MSGKTRTDVVTVFLRNKDGELLLLKRSDNVGTYPGAWGGVSGYVETRDPLLQGEREVREETGLNPEQARLSKKGTPVAVDDEDNNNFWRVHPYRFSLLDEKASVELSDEHVDYDWIDPVEIKTLETVPALEEAWERVSD